MHNLTRFETAVSEFEEFVKNTILLQIMHMKSGFFHIEIELNLIRFAWRTRNDLYLNETISENFWP